VPTGYVAGWNFSDLSDSNVNDLSANNNDGTPSGTYSWGSPGRDCTAANVGCPTTGYMNFSGAAGRARVNNSASLQLTTTGSIACWVYANSYQEAAGLVHKGQDDDFADEAYSLQFYANSSTAVSLLVTNDSGQTVRVDSPVLNLGQWYHIAATWDANSLKMYINGALYATTNNTSHIAARALATGDLFLGAQTITTSGGWGGGWGGGSRTTYNWPFDGLLDEVYLYNRVLTAAEIASMALRND